MPPIGLDQNNIASPVTNLKSDQKYFIKITSQEGCSGTAQVQLTVIPPHWIYVPDAFSPNGDGKNEILQLHHKGIKSLTYFQIYNRWGQVVFSTDQLDQGWNGKSTDTEPLGGTYHFKMEAITDKGNKIFKSGNILLLR
jgi:gliding motility-associated-like protein